MDLQRWSLGMPQEVMEKCVSKAKSLGSVFPPSLSPSLPPSSLLFINSLGCILHGIVIFIPVHFTTRVVVHDGFSDPLGWNTSVKNQSSQFHLHDCTAQSFIASLGDKSQREDRAVVVDSISSLLLHQSATAICRIIHTLS